MPELPEVETIRLGLQKYIVGHTIKDIELRLPKQFRGDLTKAIGGKVIAVRRFGKGLVIDLDNGYSLAIHVKMTGQLIYEGPEGPKEPTGTDGLHLPDKYTHVVFKLKSQNVNLKSDFEDAYLFYRDVRQFGWIKVLPTNEVLELPFFRNLGKEPLKDLTLKDFQTTLQKYKTPIKLLIMDQTKIAGVGNIYANDALYLAKIHPKRASSSLSEKESNVLFEAIEKVLQKGIEAGGASEWNYLDVLGGKGKYQNFFLVYRKDGKPCKDCGIIIEKIQLGGRGTFFCPACQRYA